MSITIKNKKKVQMVPERLPLLMSVKIENKFDTATPSSYLLPLNNSLTVLSKPTAEVMNLPKSILCKSLDYPS